MLVKGAPAHHIVYISLVTDLMGKVWFETADKTSISSMDFLDVRAVL